MFTSSRGDEPPEHTVPRWRRSWSRRAIAATAVVALPLAAASAAVAQTAVTVPNPGGLTAVGPVNAQNGFPAWYQDSKGTRTELCLDGDNPLCGFLPGDIPTPTAPIAFPTNFPDEAFYMLAGSGIDFPNGGRAVLTLGLEAAFANTVTNGDQVVFARQRIFVTGGPANETITFNHPYGTITIDTDASGNGRLTEDISPATGNFQTPLDGNIGPFLTWDTGPVTDPNTGDQYLGDPNVEHAITGGPLRNTFDATWSGGTASQSLFSVMGKIAENTGVQVDAAVANGNFLDVFATSEADPGELYVAADSASGLPSTPMRADEPAAGATGPRSFYARIDMTGKTMPTSVTVRNIGDSPVSTSQVAVSKPSSITITDASYDGTTLHVAAASPTNAALTVSGYGTALVNGVADIATAAPPVQVSVTDGTDTATAPVRITAGTATPPGLEPIPAAQNPGPVCTFTDPATGAESTGPCPDGAPPADATPTAVIAPVTAPIARGDTLTLDGSGSTNATSWQWRQVGGTPVTITGDTTARPTIKPELAATTSPTAPTNGPAVIELVASNGPTASTPVTVEVPIEADTVTVTASRYRAGSEIKVDGTATLSGGRLILTPATTVAVYAANGTNAGQLVGTAQVDTTGAWSVRLRNTSGIAQFTAVNVVSSRGGFANFTGGTTR